MDADKRAQAIGSAAGWLMFIAGCTAVNGAMQLFHSDWGLALGAEALYIITGVAQSMHLGGAAEAILTVLATAFLAGFYFVLFKFAGTGKAWPFFVALAFYGLDTVISFFSKSFIGIGVHCWAMYSLVVGAKAALSKPVFATNVAGADATPFESKPAPEAPPAESI